MVKYMKVRISVHCERGVTYDHKGIRHDAHKLCTGMDGRRTGRNFRCQCRCHKPAPAPTSAPTWVGNPSAIAPGSEHHTEKLPGAE